MTTNENKNEQHKVLDRIIKDRIHVAVYTINGVMMRGIVTGYDDTVITMISGGVQKTAFKHAISTIEIATPLDD